MTRTSAPIPRPSATRRLRTHRPDRSTDPPSSLRRLLDALVALPASALCTSSVRSLEECGVRGGPRHVVESEATSCEGVRTPRAGAGTPGPVDGTGPQRSPGRTSPAS